jgi:hypothetical protein
LIKASQETGDELDFAVRRGRMHADAPRVATSVCHGHCTAIFRFYIGEEYHPFHVGFKFVESYPTSYNSLPGKFKRQAKTLVIVLQECWDYRCRWIMILQS